MKIEDGFMVPTYQRYPVVAVRGRGALLYDQSGKEYVDCMAGYGVAILGHHNEYVLGAIREQIERLMTCHSSLYNDARAEFLERLVSLTPKGLDKVYLGNSGAEAVEAAFKFARKCTGRKEVVSMVGAYHGKTMGALSLTWNEKYRRPFKPLVPGVKFAKFGSLDSVRDAMTGDTAAVIVEPVQGERGVYPAPKEFIRGLRELCDERGVLLIFDEVQCGLARTGRLWAWEHYGVVPDVMTLGKGLGGGLPLSATILREDLASKLKPGDHTVTLGGNPVSCASGKATLDYIAGRRLWERAERLGCYFKSRLEELKGRHRIVREVRGLGLMLALELRFDVRRVLLNALERGVILLYSGRNTIRLLPPLVIERRQIDRVVEVLDEVLKFEERDRGLV